MSQHKALTYYPSNFTLTLLDGFGNRKLKTKLSNKKLKPYRSLSKMPAFARKQRVTYDKESLLEQIRKQKQKKYLMNITNNQLLKNISKKKLKIERPTTSLLTKPKNAATNSPLKREIQQLVMQIEQQNQEILRLKRSKKYNRYIELQTLKSTYLQEISQMKYKIRCFKYELKEKNRIKKQQKKRAKDIKAMNLAVQQRIDTENAVLSQMVQNVCIKTKDGMMKQINLKKEKERLKKEIYELQAKTGKIYINENQSSLRVRNEYQTYPIQVSAKKLSVIQKQQYLEYQYQQQDSSCKQSSHYQSNYEQQQQPKQPSFQKNRTKNLSF